MIYSKLLKEIQIWKYIAWSAPLIWLAVLFLLDIIGLDAWYHYFIVTGGITFFIVSVIWWWWAVTHIAHMVEKMDKANSDLGSIKKEISNMRHSLK